VLTVEEGCLMGGFGSAVLETANEAGFPTTHIRRLGLADSFVLHAERDEQLAEAGLDLDGITEAALSLARSLGWSLPEPTTAVNAENRIGPSSQAGNGHGVLAGNERSCARAR